VGTWRYRDEVTGAGWRDPRPGIEEEIPRRHWHLHDPGVVPNLLQTGAGSPTGICFYEGDLLPPEFRGQPIHCDAGPNVVRAYPTTKNGAGFEAGILNILTGTRDRWFRPSDVCVAPDGSLVVADWYDPGVGGNGMRDLERGRIFLVAPKGHRYPAPEVDLESEAGVLKALNSPNEATRATSTPVPLRSASTLNKTTACGTSVTFNPTPLLSLISAVSISKVPSRKQHSQNRFILNCHQVSKQQTRTTRTK